MIQAVPIENTGLIDPPHIRPLRVLLLDDNSFDRARIKRLSRKAEMAVELDEVVSIQEMDRAVQSARYDVILIDYRLPVGDGMLALEHVLADPRHQDAGKIMITGDSAVDTAVRAMRGGCHDFLPKENMSAETLNQAIINALTLANQRRQRQSDYQHEVIRQGLLAALNDDEVRGNVVSLVKQQMVKTRPDRPQFIHMMDPSEVDAMLAGFREEDEFIFH